MELAQYQQHRLHNQAIIKKCLESRSIDFSDIVFACGTSARTLPFDSVAGKWPDVIACTAIGALPLLNATGADGIMWFAGDSAPRQVETKFCGIWQEELAKGVRGGLYYTTNLDNNNSKCAITSKFQGKFDANMSEDTLGSKNRDTFLVMFDKTENRFIDAYHLSGDTVVRLLHNKKNDKRATATIKLSAFMQYGQRIASFFEFEGFPKWQDRMKKKVTRYIITE